MDPVPINESSKLTKESNIKFSEDQKLSHAKI